MLVQLWSSDGGTLLVHVDPANNFTFDDGNGFFYQLKPCAFNSAFPGCWVFDIIDTPCGVRCVEFSYYLEPTASADQSSYTYTTPSRTCRECYCGANFDAQDSFVSFQYTPSGATFPYTGGFQIMPSGSAGSSTTITCTPDSAAFNVACDDAVVDWDPRSSNSATVSISLTARAI